jgi:hypothetical protein
MSAIVDDLAQEAVAAFRAELSGEQRRAIGDSGFRHLEVLVARAAAASASYTQHREATERMQLHASDHFSCRFAV